MTSGPGARDLVDKLQQLSIPDNYIGLALLPDSCHLVGVSPGGQLCIFLRTTGSGDVAAPLRFRELYVGHQVECNIRTLDGGVESGEYSVVTTTISTTDEREALVNVAIAF